MVDLGRRLEKLERAQPSAKVTKLVRLCFTDEDEAAALQEAKARGIDADNVMAIRLVPLQP